MSDDILKQHGFSEIEIAKINAVMGNQEAYQVAVSTGDFDRAYRMTQPKEKEQNHNLMEFFSSFSKDNPESAKELSIQLTKFARWVQSQTSKTKDPA